MRTAVLTVLLAVVFTACSGDPEPNVAPEPATVTATATETVTSSAPPSTPMTTEPSAESVAQECIAAFADYPRNKGIPFLGWNKRDWPKFSRTFLKVFQSASSEAQRALAPVAEEILDATSDARGTPLPDIVKILHRSTAFTHLLTETLQECALLG
jgi:hypothetical protein